MICGYAVLYSVWSRPLAQYGNLIERIDPGAFARSVSEGNNIISGRPQ
jgi:hypothetical protein